MKHQNILAVSSLCLGLSLPCAFSDTENPVPLAAVYIGEAYPSGKVYLAQLGITQDNAIYLIDEDNRQERLHSCMPFIDEKGNPRSVTLEETPPGEEISVLPDSLFAIGITPLIRCQSDLKRDTLQEVTGFSPIINLKTLHSVSIGRRPTSQEMSEKERLVSNQSHNKPPCQTEPSYIDSAKVYLQFELKGEGNHTGQISYYHDDGCYGHPSKQYIFDIFSNSANIKSYSLNILGVPWE